MTDPNDISSSASTLSSSLRDETAAELRERSEPAEGGGGAVAKASRGGKAPFLGGEEKALASLFDRTATTLSEEDRARLVRRARDVGSFPRRPLPKLGLVWAPAIAAAAAVAYLAVPMRHVAPTPVESAHSAVASVASIVTPPPPPAATAPPDDSDDDPAFAVLAGDPSDLEPLDLGPLMMGGDPGEPRHGGRMHGRMLPEHQSGRSPQ
ncbi:MAG TPA: hypothetical protein VH062_34660 [Polyangiaceae bacterium]|jgi:hypothetical protein|nr:hypothetical protein [Polyangiaceae bacterium]